MEMYSTHLLGLKDTQCIVVSNMNVNITFVTGPL